MLTHQQVRDIVHRVTPTNLYGWINESQIGEGIYNLCFPNTDFFGVWHEFHADAVRKALVAAGHHGRVRISKNGWYLRILHTTRVK